MLRPRPEIEKTGACVHGGPDYAELKAMGVDAESLLDFSVCTNPFMPPPGIEEALSKVSVNRYPDSNSTLLRQRLARKLGINPDSILIGSGTTELIRLVALTYFRPGDPVLVLEPTYGEYETSCRISGATPVKHFIGTNAPDAAAFFKLIRELKPRGIFICNPNNPTGRYLPKEFIEAVLGVIGDGLLVLDEAYVSFADAAWPSVGLSRENNLVILHSMTKDYGLAGLRLGFCLARPEIISCMQRARPPWNVNAAAQAAGLFVLDREDYLQQTVNELRKLKGFLSKELARMRFKVLPSDTHYFLMEVGRAAVFRSRLLEDGILVRDCASFGLPDHVRISPRQPDECERLLQAIKKLKNPGAFPI